MEMYMALVPDGTLNEALALIEEEWLFYSKKQDGMNFEMFKKALFDYADKWCEEPKKGEYISFLEILYHIVFKKPLENPGL